MIKQYRSKKDKRYYYYVQLSYIDSRGRRHQPKFRTDENGQKVASEREAKRLEYKYRDQLIAEVEGDYSKLTFSTWQETFLDSIRLTHKKGSVNQYDGDLKKWLPKKFCSMELQDITKSTITEVVFKEMVDQEASPTTRKTTLRVLKKIFQIAFEEGHIQRNPVKGLIVKVPEPKKLVLNGAQAEKLLIEAKAARHPLYYHWAMALFTGMRSGELYGLRWADIDKQRKIISISRQWTSKDGYHPTKTNRNRVFPYSSELESILLELENLGAFKEELRGPSNTSVTFDDLVLPRNNEWRFGRAARLTSEFCTLIGVTPVKFHDLRSTFVTNLLSQGVSAAQVMSLVGHSKISTMEVYLRMAGVDTKGAAEKLSYSLPRQVTDNVLQIS